MQVDDQAVRDEVLDPRHSYIVQAPAGSGKTGLITQRFLTLLSVVQDPEEIVAITFTRKAASEMRERIFGALQQAHSEPEPSDAHAKKTWHLARAALKQDASCAWNLLQQPQRLAIQTIDSLSTSIVRQMPLLSGFGSVPALCDDAAEFYQEAALRTVADFEGGDHWAGDVTYLLEYLDNDKARMQQLLINMLAKRDQWLRHISIDSETNVDRESLEQGLYLELSLVLENLAQTLPSPMDTSIFRFASFAANNLDENDLLYCLRDSREFSDDIDICHQQWSALAHLCLTASGTWRKAVNKKIGFPAGKTEPEKTMKQDFTKLLVACVGDETFRELLHAVRVMPASRYADDDWQTLQCLFQILRLANEHLRIVFQERNAIDFVGMALAANKALGDEDAPTDLLLALDYRLQHILVDEYQDTSFNHNSLLEKLTAGWQTGDGRSLFLVGDPMQSIYRFREAEVGLFLKTKQHGIGSIELKSRVLTVNFRSTRSIVEWVNNNFPSILAPEDDFLTGAVAYLPSVAFDQSIEQDAVCFHPFYDKDDEAEASHVIRLIQQEKKQRPQGNIAILIRTRNHLCAIIPCLHKAGLRFRALDIEALGTRPVVRDLLAITRCLLSSADRIAWLAMLRAPWCGLSLHDLFVLANVDRYRAIPEILQGLDDIDDLSVEGRQRLQRINEYLSTAQQERLRVSLRRAVESLWLSLGGPATVDDDKDLADAEVYLQLLEKTEEAWCLDDITVFEEKVESLFASPDLGAGDDLQIMTLYKAKGLEFDTVILPGLGKDTRGDDAKLLYWMERPIAQGKPYLLMGVLERFASDEKSASKKYIKALDAEKMRHEVARLIYVAVTRAKHKVHLFGHIKVTKKKEEKVLLPPPKNSLLSALWPVLETKFNIEDHVDKTLVPNDEGQREPIPITRLAIDWVLPQTLPGPAILLEATIEASIAHIEFDWASENARIIGTVTHRFLQALDTIAIASVDQFRLDQWASVAKVLLAKEGMAEHYIDDAQQRIMQAMTNTLESERGQWLFSTRHKEVRAEYALVSLEQEKSVHMVIDRTFIDEDNVRWVIDYKTGTHEGSDIDAFIAREKERYQGQLERYAQAMSLRSDEPIMLALYFPVMDQWVEWPWEK